MFTEHMRAILLIPVVCPLFDTVLMNLHEMICPNSWWYPFINIYNPLIPPLLQLPIGSAAIHTNDGRIANGAAYIPDIPANKIAVAVTGGCRGWERMVTWR